MCWPKTPAGVRWAAGGQRLEHAQDQPHADTAPPTTFFNSMKHISNLRDLEAYGVLPLTGEADALSFRILCDLTERGRKIVCETFSLQPAGLQAAWNSRGVASIMLPYDAWQSLGIIALIDSGCHTVLATDRALYGFDQDEKYIPAEGDYDVQSGVYTVTKPARYVRKHLGDYDELPWPESCYGKVNRVFSFGSGPRQGTRNVHAMSGRAV